MSAILKKLRQIIGFNPWGWWRAAAQMRQRVAEFQADGDHGRDGLPALVVISPWLGTSIPWFSLAVGLMMARKGARVRFVVDDLAFGQNAIRDHWVLKAIFKVMEEVSNGFEVDRLSDSRSTVLDEHDEREATRLAELNAVWAMRGEMMEHGRERRVALYAEQNLAALSRIRTLLSEIGELDLLFVPGGIFRHSGAWFYEARKRGLRVATYDAGGYAATLIASDGMASQLHDIPRAFRSLKEDLGSGADDLAEAIETARHEMGKRRGGTDKFNTQLANSETIPDAYRNAILIALNSSWDAAALGLHRAYPSNIEWIVGTVEYLLANSSRTIIIRQHPAERTAMSATTDDYATLLSSRIGSNPRVHFIAAADPINSYELLEAVDAVVVHTSTIAMEAAAIGKPVITGSSSYYSSLGFVEYAAEREAYERLLAKAAAGEIDVTEAQKTDALLCYYITQCRNWIFSDFNPANFKTWVQKPLSHWYGDPLVEQLVDSITHGIPIAYIRHRSGVAA